MIIHITLITGAWARTILRPFSFHEALYFATIVAFIGERLNLQNPKICPCLIRIMHHHHYHHIDCEQQSSFSSRMEELHSFKGAAYELLLLFSTITRRPPIIFTFVSGVSFVANGAYRLTTFSFQL